MRKKIKKIAVLTSGGDAPGMNAAIRAVVRTALAQGIEVVGIMSGFRGLTEGKFYTEQTSLIKKLVANFPFITKVVNSNETMCSGSVSQIIGKPGTILGTSRFEEFTNPNVRAIAIDNLRKKGIEALVVIGGNGSYQGAHLLAQEAPDIQVVGIPATIDNDVAWTMETIGFDTAAKSLANHCDDIRSTAASHDRVFVVGAMGRHAGDLALKAGVSSGVEAILLPEFAVSDEQLCRMLGKKISTDRPYALVMVAEGVESPASTAKRLASLGYEVRTSDLGHAQRGGKPTSRDRELATNMGYRAIHLLLEKQTDIAVSFDGRNYVAIPFEQIFTQKDQEKHQILAARYREYQEITHGQIIVPAE